MDWLYENNDKIFEPIERIKNERNYIVSVRGFLNDEHERVCMIFAKDMINLRLIIFICAF